jgi:CHAT domain-containing protein/Flp pilus assembly protein TadD
MKRALFGFQNIVTLTLTCGSLSKQKENLKTPLSGFCRIRAIALSLGLLFISEPTLASIKNYEYINKTPTLIAQQTGSLEAERAFEQAEKLRIQSTKESILQSIQKYDEAIKLWQKINFKLGVALAFNNAGLSYGSIGEHQKSLEYYQKALPLWREVKQPQGESRTLNNIGFVYNNLGQQDKAREYYEEALKISRNLKDKIGIAIALNNLGLVYAFLGEQQKALDYYQQAQPLFKEIGDVGSLALNLNNIGQLYTNIGEFQKGLDNLDEALKIQRAIQNPAGEATVLNNIALVYLGLNERDKALEYYNQALSLQKALGNEGIEAIILSSIGTIYDLGNDSQKAITYYNQALTSSRKVGNPNAEALILSALARLDFKSGNAAKAIQSLNQVLPLSKKIGNRAIEAAALNNLGEIYTKQKDFKKADGILNQALKLSQAVTSPGFEAQTRYNKANLEKQRNNLKASLNEIEAAIKIVENLRTKVASQELRTSFFAGVQVYYEFYIDILMQLEKQQPSQGYNALALEVSERARARSLIDLLSESKINIRQGVDPKLVEEERSILQQIDTKEKQTLALDNNQQSIAQQNSNKEKIEAIKKEIAALLERYQKLQTEIRIRSPRYAALIQPKALNLKDIQQQVLDNETMLLEYSLGEERSYLWAVTKTGITSYELPKRAEIEKVAKEFYQLAANRTNPGASVKAAKILSQILLKPIAAQLGNKRLLIVNDGALQYIPFGALPIPETIDTDFMPLLVKHEIINSPSASTLTILRQQLSQGTGLPGKPKPAPKTLAVLADPVFSADDERIKLRRGKNPIPSSPPGNTSPSNTSPGNTSPGNTSPGNIDKLALKRAASETNLKFERLPFTRKEADNILALVPELLRQKDLDFAANREAITGGKLAQYKIVHLATHGVLNSTSPQLSGVVLSLFDEKGNPQNGFLRLHDIFNLNLSSSELVVLSACETGLGEEVKGEGLVGLTRGFMYAGTPRVVVSLWSVDDEATSELMTRFYKKMLRGNLKPAAALRAAQIEMWQQQDKKAPYYWAAFTLQGEWK